MVKNLIARNYKRFTFDLVYDPFWSFYFNIKKWKFFSKQKGYDYTIRIQIWKFSLTSWIKNKEHVPKKNRVGAYRDRIGEDYYRNDWG